MKVLKSFRIEDNLVEKVENEFKSFGIGSTCIIERYYEPTEIGAGFTRQSSIDAISNKEPLDKDPAEKPYILPVEKDPESETLPKLIPGVEREIKAEPIPLNISKHQKHVLSWMFPKVRADHRIEALLDHLIPDVSKKNKNI